MSSWRDEAHPVGMRRLMSTPLANREAAKEIAADQLAQQQQQQRAHHTPAHEQQMQQQQKQM